MTLSHYLSEEELQALLKEVEVETVDMSHEAKPFDTIGRSAMIDPHFLQMVKESFEDLALRVAYLEKEVNCLRLKLAVSNQPTWASLDSNESLLLEASAAAGDQVTQEAALAPRSERYPKKSKGIWEKLFD